MNIDILFDKCIAFVNSLPKSEVMPNEKKLILYKFFKQATIGNCNIPCPSFYKLEEKKKYDVWKSVENLSKEEAKKKYIEAVEGMYPQWNK
ncbi:acyl-CoA binding protein, putative [Hepatocystis sp. ex Piliocolobus tephrosceles]|nr:acyl-CoA binding protein, putative [Hepatocystis sp. ex Piliocolobus tephrosceles]